MIYADILRFHEKALKYFQQRGKIGDYFCLCTVSLMRSVWRQLFQATWKTFRIEFSAILQNLQRHGRLVESQANLIEFEQIFQELEKQRAAAEAEFESRRTQEERQRRIAVWGWLSAARTESDQEKGVDIRKEDPSSGRWLLRNSHMQGWLHPEFCSVPLLCVYGIPGAGELLHQNVEYL